MAKSRFLLFSLLGTLLVAGAATFFFLHRSSDAYASAIPSDATAIARLSTTSFLRDADLSLKDLLQLLRRNQENTAVNEKIGIDVKRPIYAFVAPSGNFGVTAAVSDDDDLAAYCESLQAEGHASELIRQRGYSWVVLQQQWLLAFDDEKALMMGPAQGAAQDQLRTEMARLLEQKPKDSARQSRLFTALNRDDEPLAAVAAPEILPSTARQFLRRFKVASSADALLRLTLETDDNELELSASVLAEGDEVKTELKHMDELLRPVRGSLTEFAHAENVAWMTLNVEGTTLLDALRSNGTVRTALLALNLAFDLDRIIRAVDGDLAVELTSAVSLMNGYGADHQFRDLYVTAQVANTDFLSDASSWGNSLFGVQPLSQQDFALNLGGGSLYFGVKDKTFYLGAQRGLAGEGNDYLQRERSDIRGSRFFATLAIPALARQLRPQAGVPASLFASFERLNVEMEHAGEFKLKLIAPRGTNIAREFIMNQ